MRAIHIGVGHDDDAVIPKLFGIKIGADARTQRRNQRADFFVGQHAIEAGLFYVENLAPQRENRLRTAVTTLLGRATCTGALDQVQLALGWVALLTVSELAGQVAALERRLAPRQLSSLSGGFPRP